MFLVKFEQPLFYHSVSIFMWQTMQFSEDVFKTHTIIQIEMKLCNLCFSFSLVCCSVFLRAGGGAVGNGDVVSRSGGSGCSYSWDLIGQHWLVSAQSCSGISGTPGECGPQVNDRWWEWCPFQLFMTRHFWPDSNRQWKSTTINFTPELLLAINSNLCHQLNCSQPICFSSIFHLNQIGRASCRERV